MCYSITQLDAPRPQLVVTNVIWRALPKDEWDMSDDLRGVTVSVSFLGSHPA